MGIEFEPIEGKQAHDCLAGLIAQLQELHDQGERWVTGHVVGVQKTPESWKACGVAFPALKTLAALKMAEGAEALGDEGADAILGAIDVGAKALVRGEHVTVIGAGEFGRREGRTLKRLAADLLPMIIAGKAAHNAIDSALEGYVAKLVTNFGHAMAGLSDEILAAREHKTP